MFPIDELIAIAERHPDLRVRLQAGEAAAREALWTSRHSALLRLARARTPQVRALGLTGLVRAGQPAAAADHLADESGLVRALARDAARRAGRDAAAWYRTVLDADPAAPAGALAGLGECGTASDAALVGRWLDHPSPRARAVAVWGLRQLQAVPRDRLLPMLGDRSAVVRQVTAALRPYAGSLPDRPLWGFLGTRERHVRRAAYTLLRRRDDQTRLRAGRILAAHADATLARRGRANLRALRSVRT